LAAARSVLGMAIAATLFLCLTGCTTAREKMQGAEGRKDAVVDLPAILPRVSLAEGEGSWLLELERSDTQSVSVLMLQEGSVLESRYHETHDLTIICVLGNAIVEVEGERHLARPPAFVFLPRLHTYKILPHENEGDFVALLVFSPPFDGKDCHSPKE